MNPSTAPRGVPRPSTSFGASIGGAAAGEFVEPAACDQTVPERSNRKQDTTRARECFVYRNRIAMELPSDRLHAAANHSSFAQWRKPAAKRAETSTLICQRVIGRANLLILIEMTAIT